MSKPRIPVYTYNIAVSNGKQMKEYKGYRCTIDAAIDEKSLIKMIKTFVMSHFGAWYNPVVITKKEIDLFDIYQKYKENPVINAPVDDVIVLEC